MDQKIINLSGGNQQKAVIARWLFKSSEDPVFWTSLHRESISEQKNEIYAIIEELAEQWCKRYRGIQRNGRRPLDCVTEYWSCMKERLTGELSMKKSLRKH